MTSTRQGHEMIFCEMLMKGCGCLWFCVNEFAFCLKLKPLRYSCNDCNRRNPAPAPPREELLLKSGGTEEPLCRKLATMTITKHGAIVICRSLKLLYHLSSKRTILLFIYLINCLKQTVYLKSYKLT